VNDDLNSVRWALHLLIDCTVNARKGISQPQATPPSLFTDAFTQINPSFPFPISPLPLNKFSANFLNKLRDVHICIQDEVLTNVIALSLVSRGPSEGLKLIPMSSALENKKLLYIDIEESILCLDETMQYYFMIDEAELCHCKTTTTGSYVCTKVML